MKFRDFARNEIYALLRLTAILSTFLIATSFTILTLRGGFTGSADKWLFTGVISIGFVNILIIWWRLKRTLYKYYNKLDNPQEDDERICEKIKNNAESWEHVIWWSFIGCLMTFIGFLLICMYYYNLKSR